MGQFQFLSFAAMRNGEILKVPSDGSIEPKQLPSGTCRNLEMDAVVQERLKNCKTLPTLPSVAIQVLELCQQENVKLSKIADVVAQDPALAVRMLKLVNSACWGLSRQIDTLDRAVTLLGTDASRAVALSFSLMRGLRRKDTDLSRFWRRSLTAGVAARTLAQRRKTDNPEVVFLAGLLQDIGVLALIEAFPRAYGDLLQRSPHDHASLSNLEKAEFGDDHSVVGAWLARRWHLPEVYELAILGSHDLEQHEGSHDMPFTVKMVALSGLFADIWINEQSEPSQMETVRAAAETLGMNAGNVPNLLTAIASALPQISALFEIDLGDPETLSDIAERAKEELVKASIKTVRNAHRAQMKAAALASESRDLEEQSKRDSSTGVFNRAYLDETLVREFEWGKKRRCHLSVVFCDIDKFKQINDAHGHQTGDRVLQSVARILTNQLRDSFVGRYGGDEFVVILPEVSGEEADVASRRVCKVVSSQSCSIGSVQAAKFAAVSISIGHATLSPSQEFQSAPELLAAADKALYLAKEAGGGRAMTCSAISRTPSQESGSQAVSPQKIDSLT